MPYQNQLPNQLPPESNLIKKESVARNRVRMKERKQQTLFINEGGDQHNLLLSDHNLQTMELMPKVISVNLDHTAPITMKKKQTAQRPMVEVLVRQDMMMSSSVDFIVYSYG